MSKRFSGWAPLLLLSFLLLCSGCGSDNDGFVANSNGGSQLPLGRLTGQLFLGTQVEGVPIVVKDTDGRVLAQTETSLSSTFILPQLALPRDFSVSARLSNGDEFITQVRGFEGDGRFVVINVPASLVSGLMSSGIDKALAEARVAEFLQLPSVDSIEYGSDESSFSHFSHLRFFQVASDQGGWNSYRDMLLNRLASQGAGEVFRVTSEVADGGFEGLDPLLVQRLERFLGSPRFQSALRQAAAESLDQTLSLAAGRPSPRPAQVSGRNFLGRLTDSIRELTTANSDDELRQIGWSHILDALTFNYGTTRMVEVNQDLLLDQISLVNNSSPFNDQGTLKTQIQDMVTLANRIANINGGGDQGGTPTPRNPKHGTYIESPGTPYTTPGDVAQLNSDLQTYIRQGNHNLVLNGCQRSAPADILACINNANTQAGSVGTSETGNFPFATQLVYDMAMGSYHYFSAAQEIAITLVSEQSHVDDPFNVGFINEAIQVSSAAANQIKQQRARAPMPFPSSQAMVDLQGGLVWWMAPLGATDIQSARDYARNFRLTLNNGSTWAGWRLPTDEELSLLQDRGRLSLLKGVAPGRSERNEPEGYVGDTLRGLVGLGMDEWVMDVFTDDGNAWCDSWVQNNGFWERTTGYYQLNDDGTRFKPDSSTTSQYAFFIVRNIARPVVIEDPAFPTSSPYVYGPPAPTDFAMIGHLTSLSEPGLFDGKFGCKANFNITIGGNFSMGKIGVASDSRSFAQYSYDQTVESYPSGPNHALQAPLNLNNLLAFDTDSAVVGVDVEGNPLHHTDQSTNATYNFSVLSANATGSALSTSAQRSDSIPARVVTDISVTPRNRIYPDSGGSEVYYCTAYRDDATVADVSVTPFTTWQVTDANGSPTSHALFQLAFFLWGQVPEELKITATFDGFTDTTSARIAD